VKIFGRCLGCYGSIEGDALYHPRCSRALFGSDAPPELPYDLEELENLAATNVLESVAVPGVQTKLSMDRETTKDGGRLTIVGLRGAYILKPPSSEYPYLPENEDLTMSLARLAGIDVAPHGLLPLASGELAYVTRRMDRTIARGRKIVPLVRHMEDFCQITERLTEHKYRGSMEQVARTIRTYSSYAGNDLARLLDLLVFVFLTGNADMHLKNFSLLYDGESRSLAPAYDLLSTRLAIPESVDPEELALPLNGKKNRLHPGDFSAFLKSAGLTETQFERTLRRFSSKMEQLLAFIGEGFLPETMVRDYRNLVRDRAARLGI
jgi:serine/threonine-protein kinase HipA